MRQEAAKDSVLPPWGRTAMPWLVLLVAVLALLRVSVCAQEAAEEGARLYIPPI